MLNINTPNHYLHHSSKSCLIQLHWLPVQSRITFKIALLTFKSPSTSTPAYLSNLIQQKPHTKILRSSTAPLLKQQSTTNNMSKPTFRDAPPTTWNSYHLELLPPGTPITWNSYHLELLPPGTPTTWNSYHLELLPPGTPTTWNSYHLELLPPTMKNPFQFLLLNLNLKQIHSNQLITFNT